MSDLSCAVNLIRKYEGFSEKAYPDQHTGKEPYTIGYGTQFYPDGAPVKKGQYCSQEKALEYLFHELGIIEGRLDKLSLNLDGCMRQALVSFIHSVGWDSFLYSGIIDCLEADDFHGAIEDIGHWIFDADYKVIGGLLDRRREEVDLFLLQLNTPFRSSPDILLTAFRVYSAAPHQVEAIRHLEEQLNPYVLSEFANRFRVSDDPWLGATDSVLSSVFDSYP
jgi:lysozyme